MGSKSQANIKGLTLTMANGQSATVIDYIDSKHMTIQFEDGTIKENVYKVHFLKGKVANSSMGDKNAGAAYTNRNRHSILGKVNMQNCGMSAVCIADRGSADIDVQFEDKTIVKGRRRYEFLRGSINNPNIVRGSLLNETRTMNCGMKATVISDRSSTDIDVKFENNDIVYHRSRGDFIRGEIACPSLPKYYANRKHLEGETRTMNCGMQARIICYHDSDNIDIEFEDGTIVENKTVTNFKLGNIDNPNYYRHNMIGEVLTMNCGMQCKVIEQDNSVTNLTVEFEDGTIVRHKTKREFYNRSIQNHNIPRFNSLPQALVFYYIKKYFNDAVSDYRPDWFRNSKTGNVLEIDIWIPSLGTGIEYDGYIERHTKCSWRGMLKLEAINNASNIKELLVINEATTYIYDSKKIKHYELSYKSSLSEYKRLIIEIYDTLIKILSYLGIKDIKISPYDIDSDFDNFDKGRFLLNLRELFKADGIVI